MRQWESAHYGMHQQQAATSWGSQASRQSEYARHLHRKHMGEKRAAAAAAASRAARGPGGFGMLAASVAALFTVWGAVFQTNVQHVKMSRGK